MTGWTKSTPIRLAARILKNTPSWCIFGVFFAVVYFWCIFWHWKQDRKFSTGGFSDCGVWENVGRPPKRTVLFSCGKSASLSFPGRKIELFGVFFDFEKYTKNAPHPKNTPKIHHTQSARFHVDHSIVCHCVCDHATNDIVRVTTSSGANLIWFLIVCRPALRGVFFAKIAKNTPPDDSQEPSETKKIFNTSKYHNNEHAVHVLMYDVVWTELPGKFQSSRYQPWHVWCIFGVFFVSVVYFSSGRCIFWLGS